MCILSILDRSDLWAPEGNLLIHGAMNKQMGSPFYRQWVIIYDCVHIRGFLSDMHLKHVMD